MIFPWKKGTTLTQAVIAGIPPQIDPAVMAEAKRQIKQEARAKWAARKAAAEQKRLKAYAARSRRCDAELTRVVGLMTAPERARWVPVLALARQRAERYHTTSSDFKIDLSDLLPAELAARCNLPPDPTSTVSPKDWQARSRGYNHLVADVHPASTEFTVKFDEIINAGRKTRGEPPLDRSQMIQPGDRRVQKK